MIVAHSGVSAALVPADDGATVLVLDPNLTRGTAIHEVSRLLPCMSRAQVIALVRKHLPEAVDFDIRSLEIPAAGDAPGRRPETTSPPLAVVWASRFRWWAGWWPVAIPVTVLGALAWAITVLTFATHDDHPIHDPDLVPVLEALQIECTPVGASTGWCVSTDPDDNELVYALSTMESLGRTAWTASSTTYGRVQVARLASPEAAADYANRYSLSVLDGPLLHEQWVVSGDDKEMVRFVHSILVEHVSTDR